VNKVLFFIILVSILFLSAYTDISDGNKLFLSSDYKGAASKYSEIAEKGVEDPVLFYNLATSYLYAGEYGKAVYWYYRTMIIEGALDDTLKNLKMAYRGLEEQGVANSGPDSLIYDFIIRFHHPLIPLIFVILVNILFFILILGKFLPIKTGVKSLLVVLSVIVAVLAVFISARIYFFHFQTRGIVISKSVEVKEGPSDAYKTIFKVDEGSMVNITDRYQDFYQIERSGVKVRGWVSSRDIGILKAGKL